MGMLEGKKVIVTGGAQGIGKAISEKMAAEGALVAVCDMNEDAAKATAAELEANGTKAIAVKVNVTQSAEVDAMIKTVQTELGGIDVLVNNAGITRDNLLIRMKEEDWDTVLAVNLKSAFLCSKAAVRVMMKAREGRIINIASVIGLMGNAGQANYAASKGGIISLTKSLAKEFAGRNVLANAIAPGFIRTAMTDKLPEAEKEKILNAVPLGKLGSPEDVANTAVFLAGPMGAYITGQVITVDGGMVM